MGVRARIRTASMVAIASVAAIAMVMPVHANAAKVKAKAKPAKVTVIVSAPKGVPANALLRAPGAKRVVGKARKGAMAKKTFSVRAGLVRVNAGTIVVDGVMYGMRGKTITRRVKPGAKTTIRVRVAALPIARDLGVSATADTAISLGWTMRSKSKSKSKLVLRRTTGSVPARTIKQGKAVKVGKGNKALDRNLKPGTTYTYALFTRTAQGWMGPVVVTAGTRSDDPTVATYSVPAQSVIVRSGEKDVPTVTSAGVTVKLAKSRPTPLLGAGFVLPISANLPGGFLGKVASISPDGRTVTLAHARLDEVFDQYELDVDLSKLPAQQLVIDPNAAPTFAAFGDDRSRRAGLPGAAALGKPTFSKKCDGLDLFKNGSITVNPVVTPDGHFTSKLKKKWKYVPHRADFDVKAQLTIGLTVDVSTESGFECGLSFGEISYPISVAPVPMQLEFEPTVKVAATNEVEAKNVGFTATAGVWAKGSVGSKNSYDGGLIHEAQLTTPSLSWTPSISVGLGGELGVGVGSDDLPFAGALASIGGDVTAVEAKFSPEFAPGDPRFDDCVDITYGGSAALFAKIEGFIGPKAKDWKLDLDQLKAEWEYGSSHLPSGCDQLPEPPGVPGAADVLGGGVTASEGTTTGDPSQVGKIDGLVPGEPTWVVSTGKVADAVADDASAFASTDLGLPGASWLSELVGGATTYDAAAYSITVKPKGKLLHVRYVFGSEEYPEYVGAGYDDVAAVLVNGVNCAHVPGTSDRVSVDSINGFANADWYIDNEHGDAGYQTSMDGLTKPLTCTVPVTPGQKVKVELHVADTSDGIYDSVVGLVGKGIWSTNS